MKKEFFSFVVFLFFHNLYAEVLEISLPTKLLRTPVYVTQVYSHSSEYDWRYYDDLRQVLEFDLNANGFATVAKIDSALEDSLHWPDIRKKFDVALWKKDRVCYLFALQVYENRLAIEVYNIARESSKRYEDIVLTGDLNQDRREIHKLSDLVHKDLFGVEGISCTKIIYSKRTMGDDGWDSEIWLCDADGFNDKKLTVNDGYCVTPGFFSKKMKAGFDFFYVTYKEGQSKIYRSTVGKGIGELLLSLRGSQVLPAMNKKADQIAFISDVAGRPDLFVQNLDGFGKAIGKPRQIFTAPRSTQASPTYSPDGKQIAFVSDKDGVPRVYVLEIGTSTEFKKTSPQLISKVNRENTSPAWSPDGTKIAYSSKVDGVRQIWIYDFEKGEEKAVTFGPLNKENPSWAPDNLHLLYNTESNLECEIYRIRIDQKDPILISKGSEQKRFGVWSSRWY